MKPSYIKYSLLLLNLVAGCAAADVIYSYTGASPMIADLHCVPDATYGQCQVVPAGLDMGALQASFSFTTALAANLSAQAITPDAWSVSANGTTLNNTSAGYHLEYQDFSSPIGALGTPPTVLDTMLISTDSSGAITDWQFAVRADGWRGDEGYPGTPFLPAYEPLRIASASDATHIFLDGGWQECSGRDFPECDPALPVKPRPVFAPGTDTLQFAAASSEYRDSGYAAAMSGTSGTWTATVVPVPASIWFMGSALALLGLRRRNTRN